MLSFYDLGRFSCHRVEFEGGGRGYVIVDSSGGGGDYPHQAVIDGGYVTPLSDSGSSPSGAWKVSHIVATMNEDVLQEC